jgi:hypothetical protein
VKYSSTLKWFLLPVLLISLGWKSVLNIDYTTNVDDRILKFLRENYFIVVISDEMIQNKATFRASRAKCQMLVTAISPRAWERDSIHSRAKETEQVFFVFRGKVYAEPPISQTTFDFLRYKILLELGLKVRPNVVLAIIATKTCDAETLPWHQIEATQAENGKAGSSWTIAMKS